MVSEFKKYRRKHIAELRPYVPGEDLSGVSISAPDKEGGSPKVGDMIARNPKNHKDQWLVAEQYFKDNFEPVEAAPQPSGPVEALKRITQAKEVRRGGGVFDYEPVLSAGEMYEIALDALSALTADKPHPDDEAVDRFAAAMKAKLKWEREERGRHGWHDPEVCSEEYLARLLIEHLAKGNDGNFEDVANLAMMLHQRGAHPRVLSEAFHAARVRAEANAGEPVVGVSLSDLKEWRSKWIEANDPGDDTDCVTPFDKYLYTHPAPQPSGWKPKDRRRGLVRAAALIIAEIERLDRAAK